MIEGWAYQTEKTALIPYNKKWPVFPDGVLGHLYLRSKQDDLIDLVFNTKGMDFDGFVTYMSSDKVIAQIYCIKTEDSLTPVGYCFLHSVDGDDDARLALFGFCFFKEYWGTPLVRELVWMCLHYWFHVLKVNVLYGITRRDNFLARNFSRIFGFKEMGILPKFLYRAGGRLDARLVLLERDLFTPPSWLSSKA